MINTSTLEHAIRDNPSLRDYRVVAFIRVNNEFIEHNIQQSEFDSEDQDINLVISDSSIPITISDLLEETKGFSKQAPLFIREYFDTPIVVEDLSFTHRDTPIYTYAVQDETQKMGLFAWFKGIDSLFK